MKMLDVDGIADALRRDLLPLLSEAGRFILWSPLEAGDPEFAIYLGLQFALLDEVRIPEPLLEAIGVALDDPAFDPGDVKASKQHGARRRAVERMPRWA